MWLINSFSPRYKTFPKLSCLDCYTNNMVYAKYLPSFQKFEILVGARQRVPTWPASSKTLEGWVTNELHWSTILCTCHNSLEEWSCAVWLHWERTCKCFRLIPFTSFALFSFGIINLCREYNHMLNLMSPFNKSPNLGWFGGPITNMVWDHLILQK